MFLLLLVGGRGGGSFTPEYRMVSLNMSGKL